MKIIAFVFCFLLFFCKIQASHIDLRPWSPQFYALQRGSLYPLFRARESFFPYWIKRSGQPLTIQSKAISLSFMTPAVKLGKKPTHMIPAARKVLEMPWDYVLLGEALRLAIKFGRPFNVVFDHMQWKKRVEDTAVFLKPEPGQIPFPGMLLGLRLDF